MPRAVLLLLAALAAAAAQDPSLTTTATPGTTPVNIFFVNDLRYRLLPSAAPTSLDLCQGDVTKCYGGLAGLSALRNGSATADLWLHAGAALGHAADSKTEDYYRLLKHETAVKGLNLLAFSAMSVDADMFRFGKGREVTSQLNANGVLTCANCEAALTETKVEAFRRITPSGSKCDVVVIGVANQQKTLHYLRGAGVTDEVQAVQDAIAKAKAASATPALYVVIGEMEAATADEVLALADVGVVLSSGTVADGTALVSKVSDKKDKVRSTLPAEAAGAMNVGLLSLTLDDKCTPTNVQEPTMKAYHTTPIGNAAEAAAEIASKALDYVSKAKIDVKSAVALSSDSCGYISCSIGQMAADAVHALVNTADQTAPTAVIIPAGFLSGALPAASNWSTLQAIAPDDPFFCKKAISASQLYGLLDDMLGIQGTFPQVSGLLLDQHPDEDGSRFVNVLAPTAAMAMRVLPQDATLNVSVAMPCLSMQSSVRFDAEKPVDTGVALSDGLKTLLRMTTPTASATTATAELILPPQVEQRVRLHIGELPRIGCEDWVGMTVAYTLLVLGSIVMVAYQGYQLWRFRTTLSYIR